MRIAFLNVPARGHTNPTLPVVAELARRGAQVTYWSAGSFRDAIERAGAAFRPYAGFDVYDGQPMGTNPFRLATTLLRLGASELPSLLPALEAERPDLIVHDSMAFWGAHAARIIGAPAVCSVTTFVLDRRVLLGDPLRLIDGVRSGLAARDDVLRFRRLAGALERRYGLPAPSITGIFSNHEPLNLVFTSRELQPHGHALDSRFRFVGPSLREEPAADFPIGDGVVYVSLGTLFNARPDFFRACFDALADLGRPVVLSVGTRVDPASLGPAPANCVVRASVPQLRVLARAALLVTHGGMNGVNEALLFGVPLVVYPQAADQLLVAPRVARLGAGRVLRGRPDARTLRRAVDAVLDDPAYRRASQRLALSLRGAGGYRRAADEIEAFAATRPSGTGSRLVSAGIPSSR